MAVCYKKLWKLLADRNMRKMNLYAVTGISSASVTKMGEGGTANTCVLEKICTVLNCNTGDIMEITTEDIYTKECNDVTDIY